jgi:hypothetical protein
MPGSLEYNMLVILEYITTVILDCIVPVTLGYIMPVTVGMYTKQVILKCIMPATLEYIIPVTWQRLNPKPHWLRILHWVLVSPMCCVLGRGFVMRPN